MIIGVPKEVGEQEHRVGLVPASVRELVLLGHKVMVQHDAGIGIGVADSDYNKVGAIISGSVEEIFNKSGMIVKIRPPHLNECKLLQEEQILFSSLHLATNPKLVSLLEASRCIAIAYETVTDSSGKLPILIPMSEVAGRLSIQIGAHALEKNQGGSGVLLGGLPGVPAGNVVIIGAGTVGVNAVRTAIGAGARVIVIEKNLSRLQQLDFSYGSYITSIYSNSENIERYVSMADLVVGAVLMPGSATPKLVNKAMLRKMRSGSVLIDVAIDQGGCFETSKPTTLDKPTYIEDGIVHYCVPNMPSAVPRTSAFALNNATLPFVIALAEKGYKNALLEDPNLLNGLNVYRGKVTYEAVAFDLGHRYMPALDALKE